MRKLIKFTVLLALPGVALTGYLVGAPCAADATAHLYVATDGSDATSH